MNDLTTAAAGNTSAVFVLSPAMSLKCMNRPKAISISPLALWEKSMDSPTLITELRPILATLYPDVASATRVVADAGINTASITFTAHATNNWHAILTETIKQNRLDALLDVVDKEYGNNPAFLKLYDSYRAFLANQPPGELPEAPTSVVNHTATPNANEQKPSPTNASTQDDGKNRTPIIVAAITALGVIIAAILQFGFGGIFPPDPTPTPSPTATTEASKINYVGRVIAVDTQKGIQGAKVTLDYQGAPPVVYTDSEGVFRFSLQFTGQSLGGRVHVEAEGYQTYDRFIELSSSNTTIEDIRLEPIAPTSAAPPGALL